MKIVWDIECSANGGCWEMFMMNQSSRKYGERLRMEEGTGGDGFQENVQQNQDNIENLSVMAFITYRVAVKCFDDNWRWSH